MVSLYPTLNVNGRDHGTLWNRKPIPDKNNGCFLCVTNVCTSGDSLLKSHVRFLHAAVDLPGERVILSDHQGKIFMLDIERNIFEVVCNTRCSVTSVAWNNFRIKEILVALANYEIRCYNVGSKSLVGTLKGHSSAVHSISIHSSGRYALSSSFDTTILWDLNTFKKRRTLNGAQDVGVQQVFFLPKSNKIMSCFKDDSIFVWDCQSMKCLYQLFPPVDSKNPAYRSLAASNDSRVLVAGGRSRFIHIWNLDSQHLIQVLELPESVKEIKHLTFLEDPLSVNQQKLIVVLTQDGVLRFIDTHQCKLEGEIGGNEQRVYNFTLSQNGGHIVTILENGSALIHYSNVLLQKRNQGTQPIVRKIECNSQLGEGKHEDTNLKVHGASHLSQDSVHKSLPDGLSMKKLKKILRGFGEYPSKYRLFIWRNILRLPENHVSFSVIADKGTHIAYASLHEKFPIKSRKLLRVLQRVLSALSYWSPIFAEADYLPVMIFPLVKMFPNNQLVCFEMVATILLCWCQKWFEYFPNPPLNVLSMIETLLAHHDVHLLDHFIKLDVSTQLYAWPMLYTLFSEVLTKDEWLIAWDNIFSNHPSFMLYFLVAYLIQARQSLFTTKSKEDIEFFFHHRNAIDISGVIRETYRLATSTPADIDPKTMLKPFTPLNEGQYPVFHSYPKFVVDYMMEERERIREEEMEYLRQKQVAIDLKKQKESNKRDEIAFYREQEQMLKAEEERRILIAREEQKLTEKRKKLLTVRRETALQELDSHDAVRRKFLNHQRQLKNMELRRLDDELKRKMEQNEQEVAHALQSAEVKGLEIESQKKKFQQALIKDGVDASFRMRTKENILRHQTERQDQRLHHVINETHAVDSKAVRELQEELASVQQQLQHQGMLHDVLLNSHVQYIRNEEQTDQIDDVRYMNLLKESDLQKAMFREIANKRNELAEKEDLVKILNEPNELDVPRGSFRAEQLYLMSQIREKRLKMAHSKSKGLT